MTRVMKAKVKKVKADVVIESKKVRAEPDDDRPTGVTFCLSFNPLPKVQKPKKPAVKVVQSTVLKTKR